MLQECRQASKQTQGKNRSERDKHINEDDSAKETEKEENIDIMSRKGSFSVLESL